MKNLILLLIALPVYGATFGIPGKDGTKPKWGTPGKAGASQIVRAEGKDLFLDIPGLEGGAGTDTTNGENASECTQPLGVADNLIGAAGGNAVTSGHGGQGGAGGSVSVQYTNIQNLKKIWINGQPGKGGPPGRPGSGGKGCTCSVKSWTVGDKTYSCTDGRNGYNGATNSPGDLGQWGTIQLIPHLNKMEPEQTSLKISMMDMLKGPFAFRKHTWEVRTGGKKFFHPLSLISDNFLYLTGTQEAKQSFQWDIDRPVKDFAWSDIVMKFTPKQIDIGISSNVWLQGHFEQPEPNHSLFVFSQAYYEKEVFALDYQPIVGKGTATELVFVDKNAISDKIKTAIHFLYYVEIPGGAYQAKWYGDVDENQLVSSKEDVRILLGKLPGLDVRYLKKGTKIHLEVDITRTLDKQSSTRHFDNWTAVQ